MSWTGTVRCSVCYRSGHNKSGCPQVEAEYKEYIDLIDQYNAANHDKPDIEYDQHLSYAMRQAVGLSYKHLRSKDIVLTKKRKNKTRQCTYCGEIGHNRRTCAALKTDVELLAKASVTYHKRLAKAYELSGYYVGGLVEHHYEQYDYNKGEYVKGKVMGIISDLNLQSYSVMSWLTQDWQMHRSIKIQGSNGTPYLVRPHLPENVRQELYVGSPWSGGSDHTMLSSKDTPVPPHVFDMKERRKSIKGELKDLKTRDVERASDRISALLAE